MDLNIVFGVFYGVILFMFVLLSIFVVFHVVKYSYSKTESFFTLLLFLPVVALLIFLNVGLFFSLNIEEFVKVLLNA